MIYAEVLQPSLKRYALLCEFALVVGGSLFIALAARIVTPLPFTPVPITGQTLAVLLVGGLLGSKRGALTLLLYLGEGVAGLPVFAKGGGFTYLMGPTGGYLVGFVAAAFVVGLSTDKGWGQRMGTTFLAMFLGTVTIYAFGLAWLVNFVGGKRVLSLGFYPFIFGDLLKMALATMLLSSGWKILGWMGLGER